MERWEIADAAFTPHGTSRRNTPTAYVLSRVHILNGVLMPGIYIYLNGCRFLFTGKSHDHHCPDQLVSYVPQ